MTRKAIAYFCAAPAAAVTTFDAAITGSNITLSNGNRTVSCDNSGNWNSTFSNTSKAQTSTGLFYFEFLATTLASTNRLFGFQTPLVSAGRDKNAALGDVDTGEWGGTYGNNLAGIDNAPKFSRRYQGLTIVSGDVIGFALNLSTQKAWIGVNNTYNGNPAADTTPDYFWTNSSLITDGNLGWWIAMSLNCFGTFSITLQTSSANQTYPPPTGFSTWD